jgi:hypothetical protein
MIQIKYDCIKMLKFIQGRVIVEIIENFQNSSDMLFDKYNSASVCGKRNICRRNKIHSISR